jgi:hypothetical protein
MNKDAKTIILSVVLWMPLAIATSRLDSRDDLGIHTIRFLDKLSGIALFLMCIGASLWFTKEEEK